VAIAVRGAFGGKTHVERKAIIKASEVPPGTAHYFNYPGSEDQAVLINIPGQGFVAYSQKCTHLSCAVFYQKDEQRLYCPCHEGIFSVADGEPVAGPPQRRLPRIRLEQRDGILYAVEEVP
jgi:Rieske Fe-S protein